MIIQKTRSEVKFKVTEPVMICDTPPSQDAFTHQIWNSYLKEYRRYAPDAMPILETRSDIQVTVTQGKYVTLRHPNMHAHTKFEIPRDMLRTRIY